MNFLRNLFGKTGSTQINKEKTVEEGIAKLVVAYKILESRKFSDVEKLKKVLTQGIEDALGTRVRCSCSECFEMRYATKLFGQGSKTIYKITCPKCGKQSSVSIG